MVYPFDLPTTSHLAFQTVLSSRTHPSLPQSATTARHALRLALKAHNRLPRGPQRDSHLTSVLSALNNYIPYLAALAQGLNNGKPDVTTTSPTFPHPEEIEVTQRAELEPEWRATLASSSLPRPSTSRTRGSGIQYELAFTLTTLGYVLSSLARTGVTRTLYAASTPSAEQRTAAVQTATKHLLQASTIHSFLYTSPYFTPGLETAAAPDVAPETQAALSSLALAEATLLTVLKDDSYVVTCIQARNPNDKDWMVRAPEIPKVRAHLFARLCIRAAEYAEQAATGLGSVAAEGRKAGVDEDIVKYVRVLGLVARARACRFFGVDAELAGKIGEGIAWLRAAKGALGLRNPGSASTEEGSTKSRGLSKLKLGFRERREERKMEKSAGGERVEKGELGPGDNAGREEEVRVLEMLETKWVRTNDTINSQLIPSSADYVTNLPSGRDVLPPQPPYALPSLDEEHLSRMRAPPTELELSPGSDIEDSDVESPVARDTHTPGAFPERTDSAYY
ncbi:pH-signaling protein PalC [Aspergillus mulundensis]|uniref:pH-response regulator protein palC n=1 Tax=Aspergillus mulundensis TaxID=1810919 RepID=A0A3D8RKL7_9EURO|nr:pH-response regulator protein palC [Aspergillus mulundensis]RDW74573.1 pH-response regulator protein palC [Aspergillus mulundensis]